MNLAIALICAGGTAAFLSWCAVSCHRYCNRPSNRPRNRRVTLPPPSSNCDRRWQLQEK